MVSAAPLGGRATHRHSSLMPSPCDADPSGETRRPSTPRGRHKSGSPQLNIVMILCLVCLGCGGFFILPSGDLHKGSPTLQRQEGGARGMGGQQSVRRHTGHTGGTSAGTKAREQLHGQRRRADEALSRAELTEEDRQDQDPKDAVSRIIGAEEEGEEEDGEEATDENQDAQPEHQQAEADDLEGKAAGGGVEVETLEEDSDELAELRATVEHAGKSSQSSHVVDADAAEDEDEDEEGGGGGRSGREPELGEQRGNWKWTGTVWRRLKGGDVDGERGDISWWERRTVQDRLDFDKFINCKRIKGEKERPSLGNLPIRMKWKIDDYLVHQGNYIVLKKGPDQNRTQRIRNVKLLPPDGDSILNARPNQWGNCAVVGNSGVLRLTEMARAIDSHDTIFRINQAPTYGYSRRVGRRVTHRVINRLWTRTYRNTGGVKKGQTLPIEKDLTFVVARATSQEYELLVDFLSNLRPDVRTWYLSSRATTGPGPLLLGYRERLCSAGFGPYKGLNVPSSGFVAIIMLLPLCERVTVYGFGVEMMKGKIDGEDSFGYHYYKGVGMRKVGDDVHCFDCEEKALQQMGAEGVIDFCTYDESHPENSWACGCRHEDTELCRPPPRPTWLRNSDDCDPEYDDCDDLKNDRLKRAAERQRERNRPEVEPQRGGRGRDRGSGGKSGRSRRP